MEIVSETDYSIDSNGFTPNYFVYISNYINQKVDILRVYDGEIHESPFPRSYDNIRAVAKFRGGTCYADYVEAFKLIKCIER